MKPRKKGEESAREEEVAVARGEGAKKAGEGTHRARRRGSPSAGRGPRRPACS